MAGTSTEIVAEVRLDDAGMTALEQLRSAPGVKAIAVMDSLAGSVL